MPAHDSFALVRKMGPIAHACRMLQVHGMACMLQVCGMACGGHTYCTRAAPYSDDLLLLSGVHGWCPRCCSTPSSTAIRTQATSASTARVRSATWPCTALHCWSVPQHAVAAVSHSHVRRQKPPGCCAGGLLFYDYGMMCEISLAKRDSLLQLFYATYRSGGWNNKAQYAPFWPQSIGTLTNHTPDAMMHPSLCPLFASARCAPAAHACAGMPSPRLACRDARRTGLGVPMGGEPSPAAAPALLQA